MKTLYTLVCLDAEKQPGICFFECGSGTGEDSPLPICTEDLAKILARQGELARLFPHCEYIACQLTPISLEG